MGWWHISSSMGGMKIPPKGKNSASDRARRTEDARSGATLVNGDEPADTLGVAMDAVVEMWKKEWGRPPTESELVAASNFVIGGLVVQEALHPEPEEKTCP